MRKLLTAVMLLVAAYCHASEIDRLIGIKLTEKGLAASPAADDARFVRRLCLVATERIPTADQAAAYIKKPDKEKLVDSLLASEGFVDKLVLKYGDLLRIKSEFPSNLWPNAVQAYNEWLRHHFRANTPYDKFTVEILTGTGSGFRAPQTNIYRTGTDRTPATQADNIALLFSGRRKAPGQWEEFFTQIKFKNTGEWKEEILYLDIDVPAPLRAIKMEDGRSITLKNNSDFRLSFARWLVTDRQFARAGANRVWSWFMGRGIVEPCDDMGGHNPATNPQLLEYLTDRFIASGYDIRALAREILLSDAFARSTISESVGDAGEIYFARYPLQRLTSEQIVDGICDVTGVPDLYSSRAPEPFTNYPLGTRAIEIGDGTITTVPVALFGRPSRDLALEGNRDNDLDSKQVLYLLNSASVFDKLRKSPVITALMKGAPTTDRMTEKIYMTVLNRYPSPTEKAAVAQWSGSAKASRESAESLVWALLNSKEFLFMN